MDSRCFDGDLAGAMRPNRKDPVLPGRLADGVSGLAGEKGGNHSRALRLE